MSAISGFINTIRNAVYGEQVRTAIVNALEACYSDVNAPSLQTEAFETALNEAYAGGILDIQTVTSFNSMTNQNIIYRYNGTAAGKQKGLYYYSALSNSWVLIGSEIQKVSLLSQMTDVNDIYKYIGTETGMVQNSLYCHNGTSWVPIGSGVLTASTAAQMTNTDAIYKYTGNESGYINNVLYYYNGTEWTPIASGTGGLSSDAVSAIKDCFKNVVWADNKGATRTNALIAALSSELSSISASYSYLVPIESFDVEDLRDGLTVTATYSNGTTVPVTGYLLDGTLIPGETCDVTVTYGSKSTTIGIAVPSAGVESILQNGSYTFSTSGETVTISNGHHVALQMNAAPNEGSMINIFTLSKNGNNAASNSSAVNNLSQTAFTIPAGASVVVKMSNLTKTPLEFLSENTSDTGQFILGSRKTGASTAAFPETIGYKLGPTQLLESSFTAQNDIQVSALLLYIQRNKQGASIEFDLSLTVNGETWIG